MLVPRCHLLKDAVQGQACSCGYLVGVVLVDDADVLRVWEPEEAKVLGFLQVTVQVVQDLARRRKGERWRWSHRDGWEPWELGSGCAAVLPLEKKNAQCCPNIAKWHVKAISVHWA